MNIHAAILQAPNRPFLVEQVQLAAPRPGEVLIKIAASGICHSDWHLATGATKHPMPVVIGHEGAGVVTEVGPQTKGITPGDHVILNWAPACGHCFYCQRNKPNLCEAFVAPIWAGTMLDGTTRLTWNNKPLYHWCGLASFAEYAVVPAQSCVVIRKDVPLKVAALVGCAVATGVGAAMYTAQLRPGETAAVFGCGGVGLSIIQGAQLCGAGMIIAVDKSQSKLTLAQAFGATAGVLAGDNAIDQIKSFTAGRGADHVFEAVGIPAIQEQALQAVRPGGTLTLAGLSPMGTGTNLPGAVIVRQEKTIKGSYYGSVNAPRDFPLLLDLYRSGQLALDRLITKEYRLHQINEAYQAMLSGEVARGVVVMENRQ